MNEIKTKKFKILELFDWGDSKSYNVNEINDFENAGLMTPYFTRTSQNNGIQGYYDIEPTNLANTFSIGSVANKLFFQDQDFIKGPYTHNLIPKFRINKEIAIFITTIFNNTVSNRFTFSKGITKSSLSKEFIELPINNENEIDLIFMENFVNDIWNDCISNHIENEYNLKSEDFKVEANISNLDLKEKHWKDFKINEVFKVEKGVNLSKRNFKSGEIPFISTQTKNNGIYSKIGNNVKKWKNSITVTNNGECGTAYYHDYEFSANSDVSILVNKNLDVDSGLFIVSLFKLISIKYSWGKKLSKEKLENEIIPLPINQNDEIDWDWMRFISKSILKSQIKNNLMQHI